MPRADWADGPVTQMGTRMEYVPMYWGPKNKWKWDQRVAEMKKNGPYKHIMGFNEPDITPQANMNPYYAAEEYKREITPWKAKGARLGSPAIAYDLNWMATFLTHLNNIGGGSPDFLCIHW